MKKVLLLILTLYTAWLLPGCTTNYYLSYVEQPVIMFQSKKENSSHITIPPGEYILFFDKPQNVREAYYNGITGYIYNFNYFNQNEKKVTVEELKTTDLNVILPPFKGKPTVPKKTWSTI